MKEKKSNRNPFNFILEDLALMSKCKATLPVMSVVKETLLNLTHKG